MVHHNVCPLCLSSEISHFLSCTDHFLSKETFEIYKCGSCDLTFTQDAPEENESGRYYESDKYISHSDSKKGLTEKAYQLIRGIMLNRKKRIISKITGLSSGRILDIGSGTGHFLNTMERAGWEIKGIEISFKAREYAAREFKIDLMPPEKIKTLPDHSFDCITLWHVLEHFHDPFMFMNEISRLLKSDGVCLIALPNSDSYDAKHYGREWAAYDTPRHLWHFNPSAFSAFAVKNRFSIFKESNLPFDVFYISILSEKYKGTTFPFLKGITKGLFFSIKCLLNKEGCSSVIYFVNNSNH